MKITKKTVEKTLNDLQELGVAIATSCGLTTYEGINTLRSVKEACDNIKWKAERLLNKDEDGKPIPYDAGRVRIELKKSEAVDSVTPTKERLAKSIDSMKAFNSESVETTEEVADGESDKETTQESEA